jgi:hypothetical protein
MQCLHPAVRGRGLLLPVIAVGIEDDIRVDRLEQLWAQHHRTVGGDAGKDGGEAKAIIA